MLKAKRQLQAMKLLPQACNVHPLSDIQEDNKTEGKQRLKNESYFFLLAIIIYVQSDTIS